QLAEKSWRAVGGTIRRFHDHGILHSDLNAANILIQNEKIFLIDFDKAEVRDPGPWKNANLERLERSLNKWRRQEKTFHFTTSDWQSLQEGYNAV
ncbi:MAG: lipopolysaccharide kinase InaA family protein, partial [Planctomycetota bacterium]|nr:lipopolysaccharide kinase InaA family protein [Planctomycetota bacterium]